MRVVVTYVVWILAIVVMLGGLLASIAVDAHHWWPRNWWPRSLWKKRRGIGDSERQSRPR